ncbi:MAG TPA: response regulator, partial [Calditrichaeota bacterium]|nr:response regulator [Calditrichota bacterium]
FLARREFDERAPERNRVLYQMLGMEEDALEDVYGLIGVYHGMVRFVDDALGQILDYLFYPEFTTRDKASKTSGRGIGLDVVANQIQKLKGNIRIRTEKNEGTTFSIRVPLTLIISQALMTHVHEHIIAIPLIVVQESVQLKTGDIHEDDNRKYLRVRGKLLPFVSIGEILKLDEKEIQAEDSIAVVLHDAGVSMALGIPEILGRQEIVIKTLGGHLQNVEYIAGGTILGSGEVALILDYAAVIRTVEQEFFGKVSEKVSPRKKRKAKAGSKKSSKAQRQVKQDFILGSKINKKKITDRKPRILIVDDSSSVRNFVSTVLEKRNFSTIKASDGTTALKVLESETVDLVITDLEMPKMHGFDFISLVRGKNEYKDLPIVILTGKTGHEEQGKGAELGANAFIGKPFKETDLLDVISRFIDVEAKTK